jgi:hypothetical protein
LGRERNNTGNSVLINCYQRDFSEPPLFGIKDPRLCRLLPRWFPIFETLPAEPHFVVTVRHPLEVAKSLAIRNDLKYSKSFLLWLNHTLQAESDSRGYKRVFVAFDEVLVDPTVVLTRLQRDLAIHPLGRVPASFESSLEPSLRHHRLRQAQEEKGPSLVNEAYDAIKTSDLGFTRRQREIALAVSDRPRDLSGCDRDCRNHAEGAGQQ